MTDDLEHYMKATARQKARADAAEAKAERYRKALGTIADWRGAQPGDAGTMSMTARAALDA